MIDLEFRLILFLLSIFYLVFSLHSKRIIDVDVDRGVVTLDLETFKSIVEAVVESARNGESDETIWENVNLWLNKKLVEGIGEGLRDMAEGNYLEYDPHIGEIREYVKGKPVRKTKKY